MGRRNQPGNEATPPILKENKGRMDNTKQTTYIVMTLHYFYTISYNVLCHFANCTPQTSNLHISLWTHIINVAALITLKLSHNILLCVSTCISSTPQPSAYIPCHTRQLISATLSSNKIAVVQCTSACTSTCTKTKHCSLNSLPYMRQLHTSAMLAEFQYNT